MKTTLFFLSNKWITVRPRSIAAAPFDARHDDTNDEKCQKKGPNGHKGDEKYFEIDAAPVPCVPLETFARLLLIPRIA